MKIPKYFYFRVRVINKGTGVEVEDASDADVVEVVRCKDCEFINECLLYSSTADKNGYCVLGERRKDEIG